MATQKEDIESISVKSRIPLFWRDKPRLWFAQFETMTASLKLGDESKFGLVVTQLEKLDVEQISDIIMSPPNSGRYDIIKERLLSVYEESESEQLQKLLNDMDLGDQRPSSLLRRMRDLARDKIPNTTLKMLWLRHMPASTRAVLSISEESKLDSLAAMADKMHETSREINSICVCQAKTNTPSTSNSDVMHQIAALTKEVASLKMERTRHNHRRSRSRSRSYPRSTPRSSQQNTICYYHRKFGKEAFRCRAPCNFIKANNSEN